MTSRWRDRFAQRARRMRSSAIRELLKLTEQPDVISFAGGLPAPDVFPVERFREATTKVLTEHGAQALQYSTSEGYRPLREMIARHTARYGVEVNPENILVTHGCQQALDLIGKVFINDGDPVIVERPTYLGALQSWKTYQAEYLSIPLDDEGMKSDLLAEELRKGPKFIYALPNFQNPAGVTLSHRRRLELIGKAHQYGVPIVEDDPYGQLRYEGQHETPLVVLDRQQRKLEGDGGNVIYLGTFSKTLAPGLRLGWAIAPGEVIGKLIQAKQGSDLHTSTWTQMVAYEVARGGFLDRHVRGMREVYRARRDAMLRALEANFPDGVSWTRPKGGLFLWVTLPEQLDTEKLLEEAVESEKVAFVPGHVFHPDGEGRNTMRLNFSFSPPDVTEEGVRRLARALDRALVTQTS